MTTDFMERESTYQEQSGGSSDGYARIYWMNGVPREKTPGRFWTFPDRMEELGIVIEKPWKAVDHTFSDGNSKAIQVAPALRIAPVCWRQQNFMKDATGGVDSWLEPGKRGKFSPNEGVYLEMLAIVEGLNVPVVFSAKGTKTVMAWLAKILPDYRKMRDEIKKTRGGRSVPPWWFWLAIRSDMDEKKQPVYEKTTGNNFVTPPIWVQSGDILNRDTWKAMYVGNDWADIGETAYNDAADWVVTPISAGYTMPAAPEPPRRNVPQPIDETDASLPF